MCGAWFAYFLNKGRGCAFFNIASNPRVKTRGIVVKLLTGFMRFVV